MWNTLFKKECEFGLLVKLLAIMLTPRVEMPGLEACLWLSANADLGKHRRWLQ